MDIETAVGGKLRPQLLVLNKKVKQIVLRGINVIKLTLFDFDIETPSQALSSPQVHHKTAVIRYTVENNYPLIDA